MDNTDGRHAPLKAQRAETQLFQRALFYVRFVLGSFVFAFAGLAWMARTQRNAQVHLLITTIVIVAGVFFRVSVGEWLALILAIALVLALEAMNTAVEAVVDLASPQLHPLAKRAKDAAAGSVLIGAVGAAVVGCVVFVPRFWALLGMLFA
ncbi:MAG: diacylglycerol kinase [Chloroflexi bacterium]|nr:MAG: diacylglycerol kinase [Chloroflexota bacterium]